MWGYIYGKGFLAVLDTLGSYLHKLSLCYLKISKITTLVTLGISGLWGSLLSGGGEGLLLKGNRYFREGKKRYIKLMGLSSSFSK